MKVKQKIRLFIQLKCLNQQLSHWWAIKLIGLCLSTEYEYLFYYWKRPFLMVLCKHWCWKMDWAARIIDKNHVVARRLRIWVFCHISIKPDGVPNREENISQILHIRIHSQNHRCHKNYLSWSHNWLILMDDVSLLFSFLIFLLNRKEYLWNCFICIACHTQSHEFVCRIKN